MTIKLLEEWTYMQSWHTKRFLISWWWSSPIWFLKNLPLLSKRTIGENKDFGTEFDLILSCVHFCGEKRHVQYSVSMKKKDSKFLLGKGFEMEHKYSHESSPWHCVSLPAIEQPWGQCLPAFSSMVASRNHLLSFALANICLVSQFKVDLWSHLHRITVR